MKLAALLGLLVLAYEVDSAAMSYNEFMGAERIPNVESYPQTFPETEDFELEGRSKNIPIPMIQYIQELKEHLWEQPSITEKMPDAAKSVDTVDTAGQLMHNNGGN